VHFNRNLDADPIKKALALWLNSTLGLLILLVHREETEGAWIDIKKPILEKLPIPDVGSLSSQRFEQLVSTYDNISKQPLLTLPQMDHDPVRAEIDTCIAKVFKTADFSVIRSMLSREPVICLRRL
jgi:hypothetical protein